MSFLVSLWMLASVAQAAPVVTAVADPEAGRLLLTTRVDTQLMVVDEVGCAGDACAGSWYQTDLVGRVDLSLVQGFGLYAEAGRSDSHIKAADYRGSGWLMAAGASAAVKVGADWWLCAQGRWSELAAQGALVDSGGQERTRRTATTGSVLAAWHTGADELSTWIGVQADLMGAHSVYPLGGELDGTGLQIELEPRLPLIGVAGVRLGSPDVSASWGHALRIDVGAELQVGQTYGASLWAGFRI